jgi:hypothetical protein
MNVKINEDEFLGKRAGRMGGMKHVSYIRLGSGGGWPSYVWLEGLKEEVRMENKP